MRKHPHKGDCMWTFLARASEYHDRSIVFLAEELEGGSIVERVDVILLGELLGEGNVKLIEVR